MKVWIGHAESGKPSFSEQVGISFRMWLQDNENKKFKITPLDVKSVRSLSQNRYYRFYLTVIAEETGDDPESLHKYFKRAYLPAKFITVLGKEIRVPGSTTELTKGEFSEYLDRICAETNVPLPDPELVGYISNNKPMR